MIDHRDILSLGKQHSFQRRRECLPNGLIIIIHVVNLHPDQTCRKTASQPGHVVKQHPGRPGLS